MYVQYVQYVHVHTALGSSTDFSSLHLTEGAVHVVRDRLDLQLLVDQLVLDLVNPDVQSLDVHLRVLGLSLANLQPRAAIINYM